MLSDKICFRVENEILTFRKSNGMERLKLTLEKRLNIIFMFCFLIFGIRRAVHCDTWCKTSRVGYFNLTSSSLNWTIDWRQRKSVTGCDVTIWRLYYLYQIMMHYNKNPLLGVNELIPSTKLLNKIVSSYLSKRFSQDIKTLLKCIRSQYCQLRTDDERSYWLSNI